jgi:hypothetical protein
MARAYGPPSCMLCTFPRTGASSGSTPPLKCAAVAATTSSARNQHSKRRRWSGAKVVSVGAERRLL